MTTKDDIDVACTAVRVSAADVLCTLFEGFEYRHRTYRQTFAQEMGPDGGLMVEVSDLMDMGGEDHLPPSILAAIELHLRIRAKLEPANKPLAVAWEVARGYLQKADRGYDA
jgi:hypothetical protein